MLGRGGLLEGAAPGAVVVDMSTSPPALARRLAEALAERGSSSSTRPSAAGRPGPRRERSRSWSGKARSPPSSASGRCFEAMGEPRRARRRARGRPDGEALQQPDRRLHDGRAGGGVGNPRRRGHRAGSGVRRVHELDERLFRAAPPLPAPGRPARAPGLERVRADVPARPPPQGSLASRSSWPRQTASRRRSPRGHARLPAQRSPPGWEPSTTRPCIKAVRQASRWQRRGCCWSARSRRRRRCRS